MSTFRFYLEPFLRAVHDAALAPGEIGTDSTDVPSDLVEITVPFDRFHIRVSERERRAAQWFVDQGDNEGVVLSQQSGCCEACADALLNSLERMVSSAARMRDGQRHSRVLRTLLDLALAGSRQVMQFERHLRIVAVEANMDDDAPLRHHLAALPTVFCNREYRAQYLDPRERGVRHPHLPHGVVEPLIAMFAIGTAAGAREYRRWFDRQRRIGGYRLRERSRQRAWRNYSLIRVEHLGAIWAVQQHWRQSMTQLARLAGQPLRGGGQADLFSGWNEDLYARA